MWFLRLKRLTYPREDAVIGVLYPSFPLLCLMYLYLFWYYLSNSLNLFLCKFNNQLLFLLFNLYFFGFGWQVFPAFFMWVCRFWSGSLLEYLSLWKHQFFQSSIFLKGILNDFVKNIFQLLESETWRNCTFYIWKIRSVIWFWSLKNANDFVA